MPSSAKSTSCRPYTATPPGAEVIENSPVVLATCVEEAAFLLSVETELVFLDVIDLQASLRYPMEVRFEPIPNDRGLGLVH